MKQALVAHGNDGIPMALELARLPRLLKGYGDTHAEGAAAFRGAMRAGRELRAGNPDEAAVRLREMTRKALDAARC